MPDLNQPSPGPCVALIGFGEAAATFAGDGGWTGQTTGWDVLPERRVAMAEHGVTAAEDAAAALAGAEIVLSLVTADSALEAARDYASYLRESTLWCDMNSVAPSSKQAAAEAVTAAGGRYVDVAVMAPVDKRLDVPLLLSGPDADAARSILAALGFTTARVVGETIGKASAIKMIRSVMVKGMEALTAECAEAAEKAGVLEEVMASLDASEKSGWSWMEKTEYNRERMETHGLRRAAEMEEVARTLRDLGIAPLMSESTAERQRRSAKTNLTRGTA